ncbi:unnamed protein product [Vicia faba]|uniref:Uncharacterized protein n=1 Tax=Vicia faba TaxID=3906 RepID=A0AAV0ZCH7_VICFA|nr:unnamed protein product [Vicia faba]
MVNQTYLPLKPYRRRRRRHRHPFLHHFPTTTTPNVHLLRPPSRFRPPPFRHGGHRELHLLKETCSPTGRLFCFNYAWNVMARSLPLDKHTLVMHLRKDFNEVVAGDWEVATLLGWLFAAGLVRGGGFLRDDAEVKKAESAIKSMGALFLQVCSGSRTDRRTLEFGKTHVLRPKGKHQSTIVWLHDLRDNGLRFMNLADISCIQETGIEICPSNNQGIYYLEVPTDVMTVLTTFSAFSPLPYAEIRFDGAVCGAKAEGCFWFVLYQVQRHVALLTRRWKVGDIQYLKSRLKLHLICYIHNLIYHEIHLKFEHIPVMEMNLMMQFCDSLL